MTTEQMIRNAFGLSEETNLTVAGTISVFLVIAKGQLTATPFALPADPQHTALLCEKGTEETMPDYSAVSGKIEGIHVVDDAGHEFVTASAGNHRDVLAYQLRRVVAA